jgi:hypothetical protein
MPSAGIAPGHVWQAQRGIPIAFWQEHSSLPYVHSSPGAEQLVPICGSATGQPPPPLLLELDELDDEEDEEDELDEEELLEVVLVVEEEELVVLVVDEEELVVLVVDVVELLTVELELELEAPPIPVEEADELVVEEVVLVGPVPPAPPFPADEPPNPASSKPERPHPTSATRTTAKERRRMSTLRNQWGIESAVNCCRRAQFSWGPRRRGFPCDQRHAKKPIGKSGRGRNR